MSKDYRVAVVFDGAVYIPLSGRTKDELNTVLGRFSKDQVKRRYKELSATEALDLRYKVYEMPHGRELDLDDYLGPEQLKEDSIELFDPLEIADEEFDDLVQQTLDGLEGIE